MSDPTDIKALDEYLKGGSDISQHYRELGRDDVPPELDRRVLDQARAAVAGGGAARSRSWLRWSAPVAIAASLVLVVTVVIESGVQDDTSFATKSVDEVRQQAEYQRQVEEQKLPEEPTQSLQEESQTQSAGAPAAIAPQAAATPAPAPPPVAGLAKAETARANAVVPEEVRVDAKALRDRSEAALPITVVDSAAVDSGSAQSALEQPAPVVRSVETVSARKEVERPTAAPEADSSSDDLSEISVTGARARRAGRTAGPRNTISGSALHGATRPAADTDAEAEQADPEKWLDEIRDLRRAGKVVEADLAWERFRATYPDFHVADDDIARKR